MIRTFREKARLTAAVHERLEAFLRQQAWLWNHFLAERERKRVYKQAKQGVRYADQQKALTLLRQAQRKFSQYRLDAQRSAVRRLDKAFKDFFRRCKQREQGRKPGFPRYRRWMRSFDVPSPVIRSLASRSALWVKGIGNLHFRNPPAGRIRQVRVVKTARGVYLHFVVELPDPEPRPLTEPVGLDLGVQQRAVLTTGECLPAAKLDRREIKRKQRALSRARKGSKSRARKRLAQAKAEERARIRERNATHRWTTGLVQRYNRIAIEDLAIQPMTSTKRRGLSRKGQRNTARAIAEQNWGQLAWQLSYKAESAGGLVVRVDPAHTSTDCSRCGERREMPLQVREYQCSHCGLRMDRDENASWNVLQRACTLAGWGLPSPGVSQGIRQQAARLDTEPYANKVSKPASSLRL